MKNPSSAEEMFTALASFLESCKKPAVLEAGDLPLLLVSGAYSLEVQGGRLFLQAWDEKRNWSRRIVSFKVLRRGRMELTVERFGKRQGKADLYDAADPQMETVGRKAARVSFAERLRRSLARHFPQWTLETLSADADLENSLSPAYPRGFLRKGSMGWAIIGCPPEASDPDGVLTYGLIWLSYLRRREPQIPIAGLALFLPESSHRTTCSRLRELNHPMAAFRVFLYGETFENEIDLANAGNLTSELPICRTGSLPAEHSFWWQIVRDCEGLDLREKPGGEWSFRIRGLEFAHTEQGELHLGLKQRRRIRESESAHFRRMAEEISRMRSAGAADTENPIYKRSPELWLEYCVRNDLPALDVGLLASPVYGQVPSVSGVERGVIDMLAVTSSGQLAVVEVKESEDPHLPLQALDYWLRVRHHAALGEFTGAGYFPGRAILPVAPKLILVAPALGFHPTTEIILRYFPPAVDVVRIGLDARWRESMRVVFRTTGAHTPGQPAR